MTFGSGFNDFEDLLGALQINISVIGPNGSPKRTPRVPVRKLELPKVSKRTLFRLPKVIQNRQNVVFGTSKVLEPIFHEYWMVSGLKKHDF